MGRGNRGRRAAPTWLRRASLAASALGFTQLALICGPSDPGPCSSDRFNCEDGGGLQFSYLADCPAEMAPLTLELGSGYDTFTPFGDTPEPPLERGGQGGQHLTTSYRVGGADLVASPLLRVSLRLVQPGSSCGGDAMATADGGSSGADTSSGSADGAGSCEERVGERVIVRGGSRFPLRPEESGLIVETGILVILDWWGPLRYPFRLVGTVEDQCGRVVTREVSFPGYGG